MRNLFSRHPVSFMAFYLLFYLSAFHWLEVHIAVPDVLVHCHLDDLIPFCKYAIVPYFAWFLCVARQFFCETRTEFLRKNSPVLRSKSETRSLASTAPKMEGAAHVKGRVLAWGGAAFAAPPLAFCPWGSSYPSVASPASSAASWAATGSVYSDQP